MKNIQWLRATSLTSMVMLLTGSSVYPQTTEYPKPNQVQLAGIAKDNSRHFGDSPLDPGPLAKDLSPALKVKAIEKVAKKVADWQLARSQPYWDQIWTSSVMYAGFMAMSDSTGDPKYREAMKSMAKGFHYSLRHPLPDADDQSIAQTYVELYMLGGKKDNEIIHPTKTALDTLVTMPTLRPGDPRIPWWWCDALFMAPPVWARLYAATGNHTYVDYLNEQWQKTYDLLWDKEEHLYARDASFVNKTGPNGKKIFWSRGEGWVMGGLARTLKYLPKDDARRPFYIQNLKEMAERVAQLQDKDGMWHTSLLDPEDYPLPEISGAVLFIFGLAYGVNEGILDSTKYKPVILKAWRGMVTHHIYADGRLGAIQQTGSEPAPYYPGSSYNYGVGGFMLAAAELHRMAAGK